MSAKRLGVGGKRQSKGLVIGLTGKPLLLFRHRRSVRTEKGKSIESIVEYPIIHCSRLPVVDNLPCLVEALQGNEVKTKHKVRMHMERHISKALACHLRRFPIPPLIPVHSAQHDVRAYLHTFEF